MRGPLASTPLKPKGWPRFPLPTFLSIRFRPTRSRTFWRSTDFTSANVSRTGLHASWSREEWKRDLVPDVNYIGGRGLLYAARHKIHRVCRFSADEILFSPRAYVRNLINEGEALNLTRKSRFSNRISPFLISYIIYVQGIGLRNFTLVVKRLHFYSLLSFGAFPHERSFFSREEEKVGKIIPLATILFFANGKISTLPPIIFLPSRDLFRSGATFHEHFDQHFPAVI